MNINWKAPMKYAILAAALLATPAAASAASDASVYSDLWEATLACEQHQHASSSAWVFDRGFEACSKIFSEFEKVADAIDARATVLARQAQLDAVHKAQRDLEDHQP